MLSAREGVVGGIGRTRRESPVSRRQMKSILCESSGSVLSLVYIELTVFSGRRRRRELPSDKMRLQDLSPK